VSPTRRAGDMPDTLIWSPAPPDLNLGHDEVHLWQARLEPATAGLRSLLSDSEHQRARNFVYEKGARRFTVSRAILRQMLGLYLRIHPKDVLLTIAPMGKPAVQNNSDLRFNLAHSDDLALYAFSWCRELGVDLEKQDSEKLANREIVGNYFSSREQAEFEALDPALQQAAFYLGWTRKEAYIKARAEGLHADLKSFDVSLSPEKPFHLTSSDSDRWSLYSFAPKPGFAAAAVIEGKDFNICHWQWQADQTLPG
jgi:4'-phosphopantetheinyl transferase